ncbi:PUR family DNA/RNA-binding protein [bacterium]|nr:PUR family DNA/RNA-binding protein [bacterium]
MPNYEELFTRRFGGGKRTYYLDVKKDTNGEKYVVISESTRKDGDKKLRNRVMVWKEDFEILFDCLREMESYLADEIEAQRSRHEMAAEMAAPTEVAH